MEDFGILSATILDFIGRSQVLIALVVMLGGIFLGVKGFFPVWWRLGRGLARRRIAVFADSDNFSEFQSMLVDSGLFKKKNIVRVGSGELKKAEEISLMLVDYASCKIDLVDVLGIKKDSDALIVYVPHSFGRLDDDVTTNMNKERNVVLVQMKGRLVNDVLTSMMTTAFSR